MTTRHEAQEDILCPRSPVLPRPSRSATHKPICLTFGEGYEKTGIGLRPSIVVGIDLQKLC